MAGLTIDLYANDGSPLRIEPPDIWGRGVGGAELSMMTWADKMASRGHQLRIYNNPKQPGDYNGVMYLPQSDFRPEDDRGVFIIYRSPNKHIQSAKAGLKVHWSTDQYTIGDYSRDIVPYVDKIVCISPYHAAYYLSRYKPPEDKIIPIDLGVRLEDYETDIEKIQNRFIYCSVPQRGLDVVRILWPQIKEAIPDATLVITSDHRLWGSHSPNNHQYRLDFLNCEGVVFLGAIPRRQLIKCQQEAQIHLFPCSYEELFCISSAECQVAGAYSITSDFGALQTTNEFGRIVPGDPHDWNWQKRYLEVVLDLAQDQKKLTTLAQKGMRGARKRFDWDRICDEWERLFEGE